MARRKKLPPEPFKVEIQSLLENGRGAALHDDKPLQVYDVLPEETVMARYLFGRRMRGRAETLAVLKASPDRVQPRCPHFGTCSACTLQHLDLGAQSRFKERTLLGYLAREGDVEPECVLPPLQAGAWNYRRKARLSVRYVQKKGRVLVGFRERDGRFVADIHACHILTTPVAERLSKLCELIASLDAAQTIPQLEVICGDEKCALIFRHLEPLSEPDREALRDFAKNTGLEVLLQPKGPHSVHALESAEPELHYALPEYELDFVFEPLDFIQVNGGLNRLMVRQALQLLDPQPGDFVLDLFCGLGNFTLPLARRAKRVTGIEGEEGLVKRATHNAQRNGLDNTEFVQADLYADLNDLGGISGRYQKILLDPPRSGAAQILPLISASGATRVLYISCNPQTLGADAGKLIHEHGFSLQAAGIMDMFPHTSHIESMALFERSTAG